MIPPVGPFVSPEGCGRPKGEHRMHRGDTPSPFRLCPATAALRRDNNFSPRARRPGPGGIDFLSVYKFRCIKKNMKNNKYISQKENYKPKVIKGGIVGGLSALVIGLGGCMELQFMLNKEPLISIDNIISVPPAGDEIDYNAAEGPSSPEEILERVEYMQSGRMPPIVTHNQDENSLNH